MTRSVFGPTRETSLSDDVGSGGPYLPRHVKEIDVLVLGKEVYFGSRLQVIHFRNLSLDGSRWGSLIRSSLFDGKWFTIRFMKST